MSTASALPLAIELIRCASVTPADGGSLAVAEAALARLGFICHRLTFSDAGTADVANLYARLGEGGRNFCFAGHTDVVPVGDTRAWTVDPFGAEVRDGVLYGRGACDMKGAIACFIAAAERFLATRGGRFKGSISLLLTGDEEGPAVNGTVKVLGWLKERRERLDAALVGEPTAVAQVGDMIKIGRRGSLSGRLTVRGTQGHSAYPQLADNPLPRLVRTLARMADTQLDDGTAEFQPSTLALTTIDVDNPATNVIPAKGSAAFNIRFNDRHTGASLERWLKTICAEHAGDHDLDIRVSGEAFLTRRGALSDLLSEAVARATGRNAELSTTGGTSDARFIKDHCPVAELGLVGQSMHKIDERVSVRDLETLTAVYGAVLDAYFPA
ncbi:MAG: succinyl-diaminopimelate desuccinylase [Alphaproteobacteria bacterium]|nr:succinyl-diaminopimelate desuccinylase [Alphaproteobacteria bacterium]